MNWKKWSACLLLVLSVAACGGGGDSSTNTDNGSTPDSANGGTTGGSSGSTPDSSKGLSQYAGNEVFDCVESEDITKDGQAVYEKSAMTVSAEGLDLNMAIKTQVYGPADTTCSGPVAATHNRTGKLTYKGESAVTLDGASQAGQKVDVTFNPIGGGISAGSTITLNGLVYPGNYFTTGVTATDWYMTSKDREVYLNEVATMTSDDSLFFIKQ